MPAKPSRGGRVARTGSSTGPAISLQIRVSGVERTQDEFKQIRRQIDEKLRGAMQRVGERVVVPVIKSRLPRKDSSDQRGLAPGAMAGSIAVKRDRLDVVIKSTLPKQLDRALGWIDFGGQRPRDTKVRVGPHVIVGTLDAKSDALEKAIYDELRDEFRDVDFDLSR